MMRIISSLTIAVMLASSVHAEIFGNVVVGQDSPQIDYSYEYESVGVRYLTHNLRLQSPRCIYFHTGNELSENVIIDSQGNLGIGTTRPRAKLEIREDHEAPRVLLSSPVDGQIRYSVDRAGIIGWSFGLDASDACKFKLARDWNDLTKNTALTIDLSRNIGIGTTTPTHKLTVNGPIRAKEIIVDTGWADHVFADSYQLPPLSEVEAHIKEHKHLPGIPSAATVTEEGVSLGEMQTALLAKIEELTLHLIAQDKKLSEQADALKKQVLRIDRLETENAQLKQSTK